MSCPASCLTGQQRPGREKSESQGPVAKTRARTPACAEPAQMTPQAQVVAPQKEVPGTFHLYNFFSDGKSHYSIMGHF